jgi:hypothetical protein
MLQEALELLKGLPTQLNETIQLMLAALGIALVKKILHTFGADEPLFGVVPVRYLFHLAHVALFAKLLWMLLAA